MQEITMLNGSMKDKKRNKVRSLASQKLGGGGQQETNSVRVNKYLKSTEEGTANASGKEVQGELLGSNMTCCLWDRLPSAQQGGWESDPDRWPPQGRKVLDG